MLKNIEDIMFQLSDFFLAPVLILLITLFAYSLYCLGKFAAQAWQRQKFRFTNSMAVGQCRLNQLDGYPMLSMLKRNPHLTKDQLDVAALEELESVRLVSRLAPMLGLIATMIPMGPALKSLADGNIQGISENLIVAFSAVIFGLVTASVTFWIASVKKRWLAMELLAATSQSRPEQVLPTEANGHVITEGLSYETA